MSEILKNFPKQFEYEPVVNNAEKLQKQEKFVVLGMGGSHLGADLLKTYNPKLDLIVHSNYGLPENMQNETLVIASSHSGETEEVIDGFNLALSKNMPLAVITANGKLLELAQQNNIPYIQIPHMEIEPRFAIGFQIKALLKIIGDENILLEITKAFNTIDIDKLESQAQELSDKIKEYIPIIYSSAKNSGLAYFWKINFNETAKIPAFYNVFPELNHNEIEGINSTLSKNAENNKLFSAPKNPFSALYFIFLKDLSDDKRIIKRMELTEAIYRDKGLAVEVIMFDNENILVRFFSLVYLGLLVAYYTAMHDKVKPEQTPIIEEFKKQLNN